MFKDKISIIIPVYNTEKYVAKCLDSILNQTYDNLEIVIINDGSTDKSDKIISKIIENKNNIKYKKIKNDGVANARNIALKQCTGKYVAFVDSDDYIEKDMIEKLYLVAKNGYDIVNCGYNKVFKDKTKVMLPSSPFVYGKSIIESKEILLNSTPYITTKLFNMEIIKNNKVYFDTDLRIFEDLLFCYKLYLLANKIGVVNECLYNYNCQNDSSLTHTFSLKMFDIFTCMDRLRKFYNDKYKNEFDKQLEFICIKHMSLRFNEKASDKKLKIKYINEVFEYLKSNYKNYKKSSYYKINIKTRIKKYKSLVLLYTYLIK